MTGQREKIAFLENMQLGPMVPIDKGELIPICNAGCQPRNHNPRTCAGTDMMDSCPPLIEGESLAVSSRPELAQSRK